MLEGREHDQQFCNFGRYLRHLIRMRGVSASRFQRLIDISSSGMRKMCITGSMRLERMDRISDALGLTALERQYLEALQCYDQQSELVRDVLRPGLEALADAVGDDHMWFRPEEARS